MKVMLIDPTGIAYGSELARGLAPLVDLTYVTRENDIDKSDIKCDLKYWFKVPQKEGSKAAKLIKGLSYVMAYKKIISYVKKQNIDIVHIQWLSLPMADKFFLKRLRGTKAKLVFTAHNVLPHRNGESFINVYRGHYSVFDSIIVHGVSVKNEFTEKFPEFKDKLVIERHGIFDSLSTKSDENKVKPDALNRAKKAKKIGIFFGNMFYNKGTDELVSHWLKNYKDNPDYFLFVVGKLDSDYSEMIALESEIAACSNLFYKPQVIEETELNAYIGLSDIIIMPYKHASMSGIIFKAAAMNKTVLTTDTGSIKEYINENCAFCADTMDEFFETMDKIMSTVDNTELKRMGEELGMHIRNDYSWSTIAKNTVNDVYKYLEA